MRLTIVRDGVITGEGPHHQGPCPFFPASLTLMDGRLVRARILTATAVEDQPVSRAEGRSPVRD